jgi:hypothetical protein
MASDSSTASPCSVPAPKQLAETAKESLRGNARTASKASASSRSVPKTIKATEVDVQDIDAILADLEMDAPRATRDNLDGTAVTSTSLLAVNKRYLDAAEEMRDILGASVATLERQLLLEEGKGRSGAGVAAPLHRTCMPRNHVPCFRRFQILHAVDTCMRGGNRRLTASAVSL